MNPFLMGMTAMSGAANPELFGSAMASMGISPGAMQGAMPAMDFSSFTPAFDAAGGGTAVPGTMTAAMNPAAAPGAAPMVPGAAPAAAGANPLSALQGVQTPKQDNKPIMNAGVSGSQKAPELKAGAGGRDTASLILSQLLGAGRPDPLRVPQLGALFNPVR